MCCVSRVCVPLYFFPVVANDLHFILALLTEFKNHFSFAIIVCIIIVIIMIRLFFSILLVIRGEFTKCIRAAWSIPTHWLFWVSRRVSIIFIFILFLLLLLPLLFGDHRWGVDTLFLNYHMASLNYDAKAARDVVLSYKCHLSNNQIVSSV